MGVFNILPGKVNLQTGLQSFEAVKVLIYRRALGWVHINGNLTRIVYRDGTSNEPLPLRMIDYNYITKGVRAVGLVLMVIALLLALIALALVTYLEKDSIMQRAQPFFLKMLCVGSFVTSMSIFTLSWDEGAGWTDGQLDVCCMLTPWFFFLGQITTFCALFTKCTYEENSFC